MSTDKVTSTRVVATITAVDVFTVKLPRGWADAGAASATRPTTATEAAANERSTRRANALIAVIEILFGAAPTPGCETLSSARGRPAVVASMPETEEHRTAAPRWVVPVVPLLAAVCLLAGVGVAYLFFRPDPRPSVF
jgi:hypothetical protein